MQDIPFIYLNNYGEKTEDGGTSIQQANVRIAVNHNI
jgi:hypothetical protein